MTKPYYDEGGVTLYHGDCREVLRALPDASVDAVITDPPYPEISRDYGRLTEAEWHDLMRSVVGEVRRVLKPSGSAVFVLQPNWERVGRMRPWLWEFMAWTSREWNMVQDAYWWNHAAMPGRYADLMRPSVKPCVWLGLPDCYRNLDAVLWAESAANIARRAEMRARGDEPLKTYPSGRTMRHSRSTVAAEARGGVTPFNVLPLANTNSTTSGGGAGHGAATPLPLCSWWARYICPPGGAILDPFAGSGTTGIAAVEHGCSYVGIEQMPRYVEVARERIQKAQEKARGAAPLFEVAV
jgi:DNA modification methylase